jgi:ketosteroid isomerase-like protein
MSAKCRSKETAAEGTVEPFYVMPPRCVAREQSALEDVTLPARPREGFDIMNTQELAKAFTDLCAKGELEAAGKKFWSDDIVSREPMTGDMAELKGRKAVEGKSEWWNANHEVHNFKVEGPYVHGDQFVVRFKGEVTPKGQKRMHLDEVGLYTVRNGKIIEESFFMGA